MLSFSQVAGSVRRNLLMAALLALIPTSSLACSRSGSPDPVGWSAADFFAWHIVANAATVDLALAEGSRPLPASQFGIEPLATTFRVIERIKGGSADRFTLFTVERKKDARQLQPEFEIDGEGRAIPYVWVKEVPPAVAQPLTSCQAGYVSVEPGRLYFVARDETGRLLDQIPIYKGDRLMEAFSLLVGDGPYEGPWYDSLVYASQQQMRQPIYDEDAAEPTPDETLATVRFKRPVEARAVTKLLSEASATPFAVRVAAGPLVDETRVPIAEGSVSLLDLAVAQSGSNLTAESDVRIPAGDMLDRYKDFQFDNHGGIIRQGQALVEADDKLAEARQSGVDGIVSVEVTGTAAAWAMLRKDPRIEDVQTGNRLGERRYAPAIATASPIFTWDGIKGAELIAKLRALAGR
jgi:hypothetical protein